MSESALEHAFCKWVISVGGKAVKGPAYQYKGIPDRICILPYGGTVYVEFKATEACDLEPLQKYWRKLLLQSDYNRYFVIDNKTSLEYTISRCKELINYGYKENKNIKSDMPFDKIDYLSFTETRTLYIDSKDTLCDIPTTDPIVIKHKGHLNRGDLFYKVLDEEVCIVKDVYIEQGNTYYVYELYYQYEGQNSAAPIKFIN